MRRRYLAALAPLALAAALTGCGGSGQAGPPAAEEPRAEAPSPARAREVMAYYDAIGGTDRWLITGVEVIGEDVTVQTDLFPKASNAPGFTGACTALMDLYPWIEAVQVEGMDGTAHASWYGQGGCQTAGL